VPRPPRRNVGDVALRTFRDGRQAKLVARDRAGASSRDVDIPGLRPKKRDIARRFLAIKKKTRRSRIRCDATRLFWEKKRTEKRAPRARLLHFRPLPRRTNSPSRCNARNENRAIFCSRSSSSLLKFPRSPNGTARSRNRDTLHAPSTERTERCT